MIIQSISVKSLGDVDFFSQNFCEKVNVINRKYYDEISFAIRFVLNVKNACPPKAWVSERTVIEAKISIDQKTYYVIARQNGERQMLELDAYDEKFEKATEEYLYLTSHCEEQDENDTFSGISKSHLLKFLKYYSADDWYESSDELCRTTNGIACTKTFRAYLRSFIRNFKGETIAKGKRYELCLDKEGKYRVMYFGDKKLSVNLSQSEQKLFEYLCFLRTSEFWQGFEELRNFGGVKKPLVVENFLEFLDESIDIENILCRTEKLGRQVIIMTFGRDAETVEVKLSSLQKKEEVPSEWCR